ncbi:MAG: TlpA disulfide reductase family protein [Planctomycetota bacterium]
MNQGKERARVRRAGLGVALAACGWLAAGCAATGGGTTSAVVPASLAMSDLDGVRHDLDAELAKGRAVTLVFWQTWCASCKAEAPALVRAAVAHADHMTFVGVVPGTDATVDDDEVRRVASELGLPYPTVRDRDLALTESFQVQGTPTIIVLEGSPARIVFAGHRPPSDFGAFGRAGL